MGNFPRDEWLHFHLMARSSRSCCGLPMSNYDISDDGRKILFAMGGGRQNYSECGPSDRDEIPVEGQMLPNLMAGQFDDPDQQSVYVLENGALPFPILIPRDKGFVPSRG